MKPIKFTKRDLITQNKIKYNILLLKFTKTGYTTKENYKIQNKAFQAFFFAVEVTGEPHRPLYLQYVKKNWFSHDGVSKA